MRKKSICRELGCNEPPFSGGLCHEHDEADRVKRERRSCAVDLLHQGLVDDAIASSPDLASDIIRIRRWWHEACMSVNYNQPHPVLRSEARHALDWCIALAAELVEAERAYRAGQPPSSSLGGTRHWVWDRFDFLEKGFMSNGVAPPSRSGG